MSAVACVSGTASVVVAEAVAASAPSGSAIKAPATATLLSRRRVDVDVLESNTEILSLEP
ncbi:hypothetical protein GCM10023319_54460 [Nocardia iowensis]